MSAAILDRARAFDMIAPHLEEVQRAEIAKALGDRLLREITPTSVSTAEPRHPAEMLPDPEHLKFEATAKFLADHGYSSGDQARAIVRLEAFLKAHPNLTREAGSIVWLGHEKGSA